MSSPSSLKRKQVHTAKEPGKKAKKTKMIQETKEEATKPKRQVVFVTTMDLVPRIGNDYPDIRAIDVEVFTPSQLEQIKKSPVLHSLHPTYMLSFEKPYTRWETPVESDDKQLQLFKLIEKCDGNRQVSLANCGEPPSGPIDFSTYDVVASVMLFQNSG